MPKIQKVRELVPLLVPRKNITWDLYSEESHCNTSPDDNNIVATRITCSTARETHNKHKIHHVFKLLNLKVNSRNPKSRLNHQQVSPLNRAACYEPVKLSIQDPFRIHRYLPHNHLRSSGNHPQSLGLHRTHHHRQIGGEVVSRWRD